MGPPLLIGAQLAHQVQQRLVVLIPREPLGPKAQLSQLARRQIIHRLGHPAIISPVRVVLSTR
jgi:hypothetical protein